ncbi:MAG: hypothetical protein SOW20_01555 [Berryella intestinalis]|uniref:hypothetical protein n=1 Tax=Berryella intestinalis TaxID=1531429 RepID=UPI002A52E7EE|nr:hypothetical protein [Berryella intestinalis]MDD7369326.1 hypothetical protein [Berryella intestinalis]MDY3128700.1 hypothetical protein [Berryella intestinalis]
MGVDGVNSETALVRNALAWTDPTSSPPRLDSEKAKTKPAYTSLSGNSRAFALATPRAGDSRAVIPKNTYTAM